MSGKRIIDLPVAAGLSLTDLVEVSQSISSVQTSGKVSLQTLTTYLGSISYNLQTVLLNGNETLGTNLIVSNGDSLELGDSSNGYLYYDNIGLSVKLSNTTSSDYIALGDGFGTVIKAAVGAIYSDGVGNATGLNWNESSNQIQAFNLNGFWGLTTSELQAFHDTKIRFDAPLYNFFQLTASRVPYLDASSNLVVSSVTPTELGYLSGVTSAIQTQINALQTGMFWKAACRVATTGPGAGNLATDFENGDTIDGVVLATGDRILIKDQALASEHGIYIVNASGAPTRATDFDAGADNLAGATVTIQEGTVNAEKKFVCSTNAPITIGVTPITFVDAGGLAYLGTTNRITVTGNVIDIAATYVGQNSITTLGTIGTGVWQGSSISTSYTDAKIKGSIAVNQVAYGSAADTIAGSSLFTWSGTILKLGSTAFTSSLSGGVVQIEGTDAYFASQSTSTLGTSGFRFGQNNTTYGTLQSQGTGVTGTWSGTSISRTSATELISGATTGANTLLLVGTSLYAVSGTTATNFGWKVDANGFRVDQIQNLHTANATGVTFGSVGTNGISFQGLIGTTTSSAIYLNQSTPSATNFALSSTASGSTLINGAAVILQLAGSSKITVNSLGVLFDPGQGTAGTSILRFTTSNNSSQTAGTNVPKMLYTIGTTSWATGALAQADFVQYTQPSILFTGASTATLAATLTIKGAVIASTNATVTTSVGLLIDSGTSLGASTTNGYGLYVNAPSGATNNYAIGVNGVANFLGNVRLTQTVTTEALTSDTSVTIVINGTTYKLLAKA